MRRRCSDHLCTICYPEQWEPPAETGWGWPYLVILAIFVVFVIIWVVQGGAFRVIGS